MMSPTDEEGTMEVPPSQTQGQNVETTETEVQLLASQTTPSLTRNTGEAQNDTQVSVSSDVLRSGIQGFASPVPQVTRTIGDAVAAMGSRMGSGLHLWGNRCEPSVGQSMQSHVQPTSCTLPVGGVQPKTRQSHMSPLHRTH